MVKLRFIAVAIAMILGASIANATDTTVPTEKEWTILTFLNGHNNLDEYGDLNINQMEVMGSNANFNIVVQWASLRAKTTKRLYIQKDSDMNKINSPVVDEIPTADMGDYKTLVEFVRWAAQKYPAKHYLVNVWNHGGGWKLMSQGSVVINDISWDDHTGHKITTEQLGLAMDESAKIIGHKVDIYASDACLMGMLEVAAEVEDSVQVFVGSEDLEPGAGWPYDKILAAWYGSKDLSPQMLGKLLAVEYRKSYQGGSNGTSDVTMAAYDLSFLPAVESAVRTAATEIRRLTNSQLDAVRTVVSGSQYFYFSDYVDVGDFVKGLRGAGLGGAHLDGIDAAMKTFVVASENTTGFRKATGASMWIPTRKSTYSTDQNRYAKLKFATRSNWNLALDVLATR